MIHFFSVKFCDLMFVGPKRSTATVSKGREDWILQFERFGISEWFGSLFFAYYAISVNGSFDCCSTFRNPKKQSELGQCVSSAAMSVTDMII